jgi:hypothetical protein
MRLPLPTLAAGPPQIIYKTVGSNAKTGKKIIMKNSLILILLLSFSISGAIAQQNESPNDDTKSDIEELSNFEFNIPKGLGYSKYPEINIESEKLISLNFTINPRFVTKSNFPIYKPKCNCAITVFKPNPNLKYFLKVYQ